MDTKVALLFAGQGAQYGGMGHDLYQHNAAARRVFERAEKVRPGICELCFNGTAEQLRQTVNAQPAIFCVDVAAAMALADTGLAPTMLAGFSLGELAALAFADSLSLEDGLRLVGERGRLMQLAGDENPSAMLAVLKLDNQQVEELCGRYAQVYPVNYNAPGQLIVAGLAEELAGFGEDVRRAGGRVMPLPVSGGFHCHFMARAATGFAAALPGFSFSQPCLPLYANYHAQPYMGDMAELLVKQMTNPVQWQASIEHMAKDGATVFVEVGPGSTLSNLVTRIVPQAAVYNVEDSESLQKTIEGLGLC